MTLSPLVVSVSGQIQHDIADRITAGGASLASPEPIHAAKVERATLRGATDCIVLDGRFARPSAVYRAVVRIRSLGWSGIIVLVIDPDAIGITAVAASLGVDDFVVSTASTEELMARLRRRGGIRTHHGSANGAAVPAGIELHWRTHHVSCGGTRIPVTLRQMQLLDVLMARPGEIVTAGDLARLAWGKSRGRGGGLAATFVCSLRKKLAWFGGSFGIQTVRGVGYRFVQQHDVMAQVSNR